MLSSSTTTLATRKPSPNLSRRELSCVVNHVNESAWKQLVQVLNVKQPSTKRTGTQKTRSENRFDSVKGFATATVLEERSVMVGGNVTGNLRNKVVQQLLRSGNTSLAMNIETGMIDSRVPSNFLCNF